MKHLDSNPPTCPRCGYDQSGAAAMFTLWCPRHGTCSECGAEFAWRDAYMQFVPPVWSYEHGRAFDHHRFVATLKHLATPSRFWREMPPLAPLRLRRVALLAVAPLIAFAALLVAIELFPDEKASMWRGMAVPASISSQVNIVRIIASGLSLAFVAFTIFAVVLCGAALRHRRWARSAARAWSYSLLVVALATPLAAAAMSVVIAFPHIRAIAACYLIFMLALVLTLLIWLLKWWIGVARAIGITQTPAWIVLAAIAAAVGTSGLGDLAAWNGLWPI